MRWPIFTILIKRNKTGMDTKKPSVAVVVNNPKTVALYFDKVASAINHDEIPDDIRHDFGCFLAQDYKDIIASRSDPDDPDDPEVVTIEYEKEYRKDETPLTEEEKEKVVANFKIYLDCTFNSSEDFLLHPIYYEIDAFHRGNKALYPDAQNQQKYPVIDTSLVDVPIISGEQLEWEQILEVKKDSKSEQDLRNFRLFLNENLIDKSKDHALDILEKKYEDYQFSLKKHGILTATGTLKQIIQSNSVLASALTSIVGATTGNTALMGSGAAAGALLALSEFSVLMSERRISKQELDMNEMAYIYKINQMKND